MDEPITLSTEQLFSLRSFEIQVKKMSHEQAQEFLLKLYKHTIVQETMYQHFLKHKWGIEPPTLG